MFCKVRIKEKGTARVRVEILPEESKNLKELAIASQNTDIYEPNITYSSAEIQPEQSKVQKPAPAPAPVEPAPAPVSAHNSDYFVQVAAYSTYEKAEALKDKLTTFGTVKIFKSVVNGETLYKVRLGEFTSKEEAEKVQKQVTDSGINGSRVILKEDGAFKWNIK